MRYIKIICVCLLSTIILGGCYPRDQYESEIATLKERNSKLELQLSNAEDAFKERTSEYNALKEKCNSTSETEQSSAPAEETESEVETEMVQTEGIMDPFQLSAGTFIIGEDIPSGKYDFIANTGSSQIYIYKSYDDFKDSEYSFTQTYNLGAEGSTGLESLPDLYSKTASNVRLSDGECLVINSGLTIDVINK